jgi:hypothetical protein
MPGQVYIFARDIVDPHTDASPLSDVINAITIAARDSQHIRYEVLTEEGNPKPMIAIVFTDAAVMGAFGAQLAASLPAWNLRILSVHTPRNL